jgi:hypothetical protein
MTPDPADTVVQQEVFVVPDFSIKELLDTIPYVPQLVNLKINRCANTVSLVLTVTSGLPFTRRATCTCMRC